MTAGTDWWVVMPSSEAAQYSNSATIPPNSRIYSTPKGSAGDNALLTGGTVTIGLTPYSRVVGPYPSQAAAQAAKPDNSTIAGITAGIQAGSQAAGGVGLPSFSGFPNLGSIDDLIAFFKQGNIWERGAEIVAGFILLYVGLKAITTPAGQEPAKRGIKETAKTIAKVAAK